MGNSVVIKSTMKKKIIEYEIRSIPLYSMLFERKTIFMEKYAFYKEY